MSFPQRPEQTSDFRRSRSETVIRQRHPAVVVPPESPARRFLDSNSVDAGYVYSNPRNKETLLEVLRLIVRYNEVPQLQIQDSIWDLFSWTLTFPQCGTSHRFSFYYAVVI